MTGAPVPVRERWVPLRLGLVDLFYYDREEFHFHDGRLLLRGNNGTGKSKVLALTLPFLLDGDLSAHRVEPDADPSKRMEWNLLLGGDHPHDERLGYAWLEFGRLTEDGPAYTTIGCGMKAVRGRGIARHWFFVTEQRVGPELALVDATGIALTADRLGEAIGVRGAVHQTARSYRRAVDERLFGLGEARYAALIDLLIRIRAPQLSKRPDEQALSAALTGALPPLDPTLVTDVADAFRALEENREELEAMQEASRACARYLETYRAYARMASRRRAAPLRQAQTTFDRVGRELTEARAADARAAAALLAGRERRETLRGERARSEAERDALREGPAARSAEQLRRAADDARIAERTRADAQDAVTRLAERVQRTRASLTGAERELTDAATLVDAARVQAARLCASARVDAAWTDATETADPGGDDARAALRRHVDGLLDARRTAITHVQDRLRAWRDAEGTLARARASTGQLDSEHATATDRRDERRADADAAAAGYLREVRGHLEHARELALPDPAATIAALEDWLRTRAGLNPLPDAVAAAGRDGVGRLHHDRAAQEARTEEIRAGIDELQRQITQLEAGVDPVPPVPHTRAPDVRRGRAGAPLWQLVDFRDGVDEAERSGLEAALEAAGLLDGWVTPAGVVIDPDTDDVLLAPRTQSASGPRLSELLVASAPADTTITPAEVTALLDAIGLGEGEGEGEGHAGSWVTVDGRFRQGLLHGAWHKQAAVHIGHAAREAARVARLTQLRGERDRARLELAGSERALAQLRDRLAVLERELTELPGDDALRSADAALTVAEAQLTGVTERLTAAREAERQALDAERGAHDELVTDAGDLDLPVDGEALRGIEVALGALRETAAGLWPLIDRRLLATRAVRAAAEALASTEAEQGVCDERLAEAGRRHDEAAQRRDTLQETAGAAIAELERRLADVATVIAAADAALSAVDEELQAAARAAGAAQALARELTGRLQTATETRDDAVTGLRLFASTGLIAVALPTLALPGLDADWNVTAGLRVAREIEQALNADADEESRWQRLQRRVTDELGGLSDALRRHGNNASMTIREGGAVIEVVFRGHAGDLPTLAAALAQDVVERERLLDAREREILENHLVGEVASALQERIAGAERRVADTNHELAERPTSTGMQLRLRWIVDPHGPEGLADARARLLRQSADAWSPADREAAGAFLQEQIRAARARDSAGPWVAQLTEALDYRRWHRFVVERRQSGVWRSASGPSSGGERVLAASVPLFAAASSYYSSARDPHAPRLVMLDEAFAGVDDRARAACLGLLASFDLDVVMTSEREWGCYAEVPGLAIAQLSRIDGVAAVLVSRWEWDGAIRRALEAPEPIEAPGAGAPTPAVDAETGPSLWDTSTPSD